MAFITDYNCFTPVVRANSSIFLQFFNFSKKKNFKCFFLGFRQEQDIYVRLIDSVSKQVKYLNEYLNFWGVGESEELDDLISK